MRSSLASLVWSWATILSRPVIPESFVKEYRQRAFLVAFISILMLSVSTTALTFGRSWPAFHADSQGRILYVYWSATGILFFFRRWARVYYPWVLAPVSVLALINVLAEADPQPGQALDLTHLRLMSTFVFVTVLFRLPYRIAGTISGGAFVYVAWLFTRYGNPNSYAALVSLFGIISLCVLTLRSVEARERDAFTQRKNREQELLDLERVNIRYRDAHLAAVRLLDQQKVDTDQAIAAKNDFIKKAAHDLRNSIGGIENYLDAIQSSVRRGNLEVAADQLEQIAKGTEALSIRLNQILAFTRIDSALNGPVLVPIDLRKLLAEIDRELSPRALAKRIELRVCTPGTEPLIAESDSVTLWQILTNLVSNAIKFTYPQPRKTSGVVVGAVRIGSKIQVNVWDTGIGIPPEYIDLIWKPHQRVASTKAPKEEGDGLGLAIVEAACRQLHGHHILVSSTPDRGTHFRLELPASASAPEIYGSEDATENPIAAGSLKLILLEDDNFFRRSHELLLEDWGATLLASGASLEEVLISTARNFPTPDVILSDFELGTENAKDAILSLREKYAACIPAIVVTGRFEDAAEALVDMQALRLFSKPVQPEQLRRVLSGLVRTA